MKDLKYYAAVLSSRYGILVEVSEDFKDTAFYSRGEVLVSKDTPVCVLFHEFGHGVNSAYGEAYEADEILAWDTGRAIAVEVGYVWTDEDDAAALKALASYGLSFSNGRWSCADELSRTLYAPASIRGDD